MKDFRTKIAVAAVIFGLGGLGGFAIVLEPRRPRSRSNGADPAAGAHPERRASPVTTGTSGADERADRSTRRRRRLLPRQSVLGKRGPG